MSIHVYANAPTPVSHGANRLSDYTGLTIGDGDAAGPRITIDLNSSTAPGIGSQGYAITGGATSQSETGDIAITANHQEGLTNGIYTLLRILMVKQTRDPFSLKWDICEEPHFPIRAMLIAPYRFGGSYGFAAMSPDRWSIDEWKDYVDLMRLCNMTTLTMASARIYNPAYPHSERERWRYEVWKEVMDYCHQLGMRFNWFTAPNIVCEQAFWENPDLRADSAKANWYGNSLIWSKAKDLILENQRHGLEFFAGLDGLEMIYTDGGSISFDPATGADPAGYFADATRSYMALMREVGNDADFVFWNWGLDVWAKVLIPPDETERYPKYATMQDDVVGLLPKNVAWLDASLLTWIQCYSPFIKARGNPALREHILFGRESGFEPTIDFFWYMNPEFSINMLPHPYVGRGIQEAHYARDELHSDGVMGYRLAPACRFADDYIFFRLASNPGMGENKLIAEAAAMLCWDFGGARRGGDRLGRGGGAGRNLPSAGAVKSAEEAIHRLEEFWSTHDIDDIDAAAAGFAACGAGVPAQLEYTRDATTFLSYVARLASAKREGNELEYERLSYELYEKAKEMFVFQGLVADMVCVADAIPNFMFRLGRMVEEYATPLMRESPFPEYVDRRIYPEATAEPKVLDFSASDQNYNLNPAEVMKIARIATMNQK